MNIEILYLILMVCLIPFFALAGFTQKREYIFISLILVFLLMSLM